MIKIDKSDNGKKIKAKKGDIIELHLDENPTTGYRWVIKSVDEKQLKVSEKEQKTENKGIGAGGVKIFQIEVIGEDSSKLNLSHENSWEKDSTETFSITVGI